MTSAKMTSAVATAVLALLLLAAASSVRGQASLGNPSFCCSVYTAKPVPLRLLASYEYTHHTCSLPAVVLITKTQVKICADPRAQWVQQRIARLPAN